MSSRKIASVGRSLTSLTPEIRLPLTSTTGPSSLRPWLLLVCDAISSSNSLTVPTP